MGQVCEKLEEGVMNGGQVSGMEREFWRMVSLVGWSTAAAVFSVRQEEDFYAKKLKESERQVETGEKFLRISEEGLAKLMGIICCLERSPGEALILAANCLEFGVAMELPSNLRTFYRDVSERNRCSGAI